MQNVRKPLDRLRVTQKIELEMLLPTELTGTAVTAMHVELAPSRCEAVPVSGRWRGAKGVAGEVEPGHGGRIVHVEIVTGGCSKACGACSLSVRIDNSCS